MAEEISSVCEEMDKICEKVYYICEEMCVMCVNGEFGRALLTCDMSPHLTPNYE